MKRKKIKRRLTRSYFVVTISIALILFMIGLNLILLLNTDKLSNYVRENVGFTLVLNEGIKEIEIIQLQKNIATSEFVKSATYVDKEKASKDLSRDLGEDFVGFLGYNPLFASIDVKLRSEWLQPDSLLKIEKTLLSFSDIKEIYYQRDLVHIIHKNIKTVSLAMLIVSAVLLLIFIVLISNTIRLSIYARRFDINTMKLVGAKYGFIRRPFVLKIVSCGLLAGFIANVCILLLIIFLKQYIGNFIDPMELKSTGFTVISVFVLGIIISYISAVLSVNKYMKLHYDDLF